MRVHPLKARISAQAGVTRVDVYDDVGGDFFGEGVTAKAFAGELAGVRGALDVHVNSPGGNVWDGIAIASALRTHNGPVTVVVDGIAASIASVIVQAGAERVMMPGSMMMIHEASTYGGGNAAELRKTAQTLDDVSANLAEQYAARAGGTAESWRAAMQEETWYTAEQAVEAGLADRIGDGDATLPVGMDLAAYGAVPGQIAARLKEMPVAAPPAVPQAKAPALLSDEDFERLVDQLKARLGEPPPAALGAPPAPEAGSEQDAAVATLIAAGYDPDALQLAARQAATRGDVDTSPWDAAKALHNAAQADDPEAFYAGICAGKRTGDPSKQGAWALPYRYHPSDPPNADGVRAALAWLSSTRGLINKDEARATLEDLMKTINPDYEPDDRIDPGLLSAVLSQGLIGGTK